ncbi:MAG TPA: hypothetical protein VH599_10280 [Ktedonobacterales bacterium]
MKSIEAFCVPRTAACTAAVPGGEPLRPRKRPPSIATFQQPNVEPPGRDARATNGSENAEA